MVSALHFTIPALAPHFIVIAPQIKVTDLHFTIPVLAPHFIVIAPQIKNNSSNEVKGLTLFHVHRNPHVFQVYAANGPPKRGSPGFFFSEELSGEAPSPLGISLQSITFCGAAHPRLLCIKSSAGLRCTLR
ncbi:hypothetical protein CDAR_384841 [Caerostris darwini]|uniref:Uncharacterized protein n=1 Tax=Caerostris darwini TaxID=1538125 RepID=A0AAV4WBR1_9ARAC|nr:hypothetical protein CDAR_384841 [Caerostris darwini]